MKKIAKVLSSVLAVSMLMSTFAVNSFAAGQHTVTVSADKTADIVAGDVITVSVTIDTNADISACEYDLLFDKDVFSVDYEHTTFNEDEEIDLPNYIDYDWFFDEESVLSNKWFNRLGFPTYNPDPTADNKYANPGQIYFGVAAQRVVTSANTVENLCIGKFKFTVTDAVEAGEDYTFSLSNASVTADAASVKSAMISVPVTVTAKAADEPVVPEIEYTAADFNTTVGEDKGYVWSNVLEDVDTAAGEYFVTFKSDAATDNTKTFDLEVGDLDLSSTIFDIVLKTKNTIVGCYVGTSAN